MAGRKPKYDYRSDEFLEQIEKLAKNGLTDKEIALSIGISHEKFCQKKSSISQLSQSLACARAQINSIVRQKYLAIGLGQVKTKTIVRRKVELEDGSLNDGEVICETETEIAPNSSVLNHWLYHHDEEWRQKELDGKRLDVTTNGKDVVGPQLIFSNTPLSEKDIQEIKNIQNGVTEENSTDASLSEA